MSFDFAKSAQSIHWRTNSQIVQCTEKLFGVIDLDPAAGQTSIATVNLRLEDGRDGLLEPWPINAKNFFINPPFGVNYVKDGFCISSDQFRELKRSGGDIRGYRRQTMALWTKKVAEEVVIYGREGLWLSKYCGSSISGSYLLEVASAVLMPPNRIPYVDSTGKLVKGSSFDSWLVYFGKDIEAFEAAFSSLDGKVLTPRRR